MTQVNLVREAARLGAEHALRAASWAVDSSRHGWARELLQMMTGGDAAVWEYLPDEPNLTGDHGGLTPNSLFQAITGRRPEAADGELVEALADAYEETCAQTFGPACCSELQRVAGVPA